MTLTVPMERSKLPISVVIVSYNEEKRIGAAISSIADVVSEILVVDSNSTDRTREIAESLGARVLTQEYLGDGQQKNFASQQARHEWVLSLDCDERASEELVETLRELDLETSTFDSYFLARRNLIGNRWVKVAGWYPNRLHRLYRKTRVSYSEKGLDDVVESKNFGSLEGDLIHYSYQHLGQLFSKADYYSGVHARLMHRAGRRAHLWDPWTHGIAAFFKKLLLQKGWMGGLDGFTISISAFIHHYLKYARLLEYQQDPAQLESSQT